MDFKEFLKAFLTKTLGMDETEIAALYDAEGILKSDSLQTALAKDATRIQEKQAGMQEKITKAHETGYSKAKGEVMVKFEQDFKDKYKIESDKKGLELVDEVIAKKSIDKSITDEDVKKHPLFLAEEGKSKKAVDAKDSEWKKKFDERETLIKQKEILSTVLQDAYVQLEKLNPNLPEDPSLKKNHLKWFEQEIANIKFEIKENADGTRRIIPLKKDSNERLEDDHGNAIPFEEIVKKTASNYWTFKQSEDRNTADPKNKGGQQQNQGNQGNGQQGAGVKKWKFTKPKDDKEFQKTFEEIEKRKDLNPAEKTQAKNELVDIFQEEPAKT